MPESRKRMVDLLMDVDDNDHILRLFVLNHGLRLMQMWFHSPDFTLQSIRMQASIAKLLFRLPVKYKNQINETQIMQTIEQILEMVFLLHFLILQCNK
jgi:hypothetical protein